MALDLCIGFSRTNSFISRVFQWFMRSKTSHAFLVVTLNDRIRFTLGADDRGLHWQSLDLFKSKSEIVAVFTPIGAPIDDHFWWMVDKYGDTDYDYMAAGAVGFRNRIGWIWKVFKRIWRKSLDPHKITCMEFITRMLQRAQYPSVMKEDPEMFDTQMLMRRLFEVPKEYRVEWVNDIIQEEPYVHS